MNKKGVTHTAIVAMFDRKKTCVVTAFGDPQQEYSKEKTLWVERGEDMYAFPHYKEPFCILNRNDWMRGE